MLEKKVLNNIQGYCLEMTRLKIKKLQFNFVRMNKWNEIFLRM